MNKNNFSYIAAGLGALLMVVALKGSEVNETGSTLLPLLTLLLVCEFGAVVTAIGAFLGYKHFPEVNRFSKQAAVVVSCVFMCALFIFKGYSLWPQ
ncbi:MAG: hypothetical protein D6B25_17810 [Desulfobulbaceae bacterium]|nr:MAG: hypothetical protein D6B25_17810 [Desulfobulbaceae bacterium]